MRLGHLMLGGGMEGGGMDFGFTFELCYRYNPKYAFGIGLGFYEEYLSEWYLFNINAIKNFSIKKLSPYIGCELGVSPWGTFAYDEDGYIIHGGHPDNKSGTDLYFGIIGGYQYSFNSKWAVKAQGRTTLGKDSGINYGGGLGIVYHFK